MLTSIYRNSKSIYQWLQKKDSVEHENYNLVDGIYDGIYNNNINCNRALQIRQQLYRYDIYQLRLFSNNGIQCFSLNDIPRMLFSDGSNLLFLLEISGQHPADWTDMLIEAVCFICVGDTTNELNLRINGSSNSTTFYSRKVTSTQWNWIKNKWWTHSQH